MQQAIEENALEAAKHRTQNSSGVLIRFCATRASIGITMRAFSFVCAILKFIDLIKFVINTSN
jgi:hypothetical protein